MYLGTYVLFVSSLLSAVLNYQPDTYCINSNIKWKNTDGHTSLTLLAVDKYRDIHVPELPINGGYCYNYYHHYFYIVDSIKSLKLFYLKVFFVLSPSLTGVATWKTYTQSCVRCA